MSGVCVCVQSLGLFCPKRDGSEKKKTRGGSFVVLSLLVVLVTLLVLVRANDKLIRGAS